MNNPTFKKTQRYNDFSVEMIELEVFTSDNSGGLPSDPRSLPLSDFESWNREYASHRNDELAALDDLISQMKKDENGEEEVGEGYSDDDESGKVMVDLEERSWVVGRLLFVVV